MLTQKNIFPAWKIGSWHVYPNPMSRFADPYRPDRPPYPPDDYAARMLSPNPQRPSKKSGSGRFEGEGYLALLAQWDAENRALDPPKEEPKPPGEMLPPPRPIDKGVGHGPRHIPGREREPGATASSPNTPMLLRRGCMWLRSGV